MNTQSYSLKTIRVLIGLFLLTIVTYSNAEDASSIWSSDDQLIEILAQPQYNDKNTINNLTLNITDKTLGEYQYEPLIYTLSPPYTDQRKIIEATPKKSTLNGHLIVRKLTQFPEYLFIVVDLYYGDMPQPTQHHVMGSILRIPIQDN
ncbi:hypothetical protein BFW38_05365 [Terasakiispira papahanaumokuakeensis]|uniref:Uncharacterized protein n=1 Tax=Terasakiispira papahanaumokuakeensis TaxID=197479 RepID=A0A1E2V7V0_9GAMM|nr:hypothetical protein [Terasakiispira papahanaumokuakeensis]ODC03061.1 hypothetical protein BFW38_05365 [Terasakiispira papahanaumokuakeensis]